MLDSCNRLGLMIAMATTGCLHAPILGPRGATSADPVLVAKCTSARTRHNNETLGAAALAGLAGMGGAAALIQGSDTPAQIGRASIGVTALLAGFAAGLVGGFASVAADNYSKSHCDTVEQP